MRTGAPVDPDELRANLRQADPGVLVAVLAQLTGDPAVVDRFAPKITHVPDPPEQAGVTDPETAEALVEAVVAALAVAPLRHAPYPPTTRSVRADRCRWRSGGPSAAEYLPLLLEQGGFQPPQPVLPRTAKLPDDFRVAIIGAGIAGIDRRAGAARTPVSSYQIFDRNDEVGGTWYTTTYPGIGVDTPSAYYSLSRDINGDWSSYYPQGAEYQSYLVSVADKNNLRQHTRFGTEVEALWWDDERNQWQIHAVDPDGTRDVSYANVVIPAAGYLNRPRWPDLPGRETFAGVRSIRRSGIPIWI